MFKTVNDIRTELEDASYVASQDMLKLYLLEVHWLLMLDKVRFENPLFIMTANHYTGVRLVLPMRYSAQQYRPSTDSTKTALSCVAKCYQNHKKHGSNTVRILF